MKYEKALAQSYELWNMKRAMAQYMFEIGFGLRPNRLLLFWALKGACCTLSFQTHPFLNLAGEPWCGDLEPEGIQSGHGDRFWVFEISDWFSLVYLIYYLFLGCNKAILTWFSFFSGIILFLITLICLLINGLDLGRVFKMIIVFKITQRYN